MAHHEGGLLRVLKAVLPPSVQQVIVLADRGFGSVDLYDSIKELGWDFVIRFPGVIAVTAPDGRALPLGHSRPLPASFFLWQPIDDQSRRSQPSPDLHFAPHRDALW